VNAQLLSANGDPAAAASLLASAQAVIVQRFGAAGFYNLLVKRRALLIANARKV
jgi:hypothetical protein